MMLQVQRYPIGLADSCALFLTLGYSSSVSQISRGAETTQSAGQLPNVV